MYNKMKSLKYRDATNFCDRRQTHIKGEGVLWELQQLGPWMSWKYIKHCTLKARVCPPEGPAVWPHHPGLRCLSIRSRSSGMHKFRHDLHAPFPLICMSALWHHCCHCQRSWPPTRPDTNHAAFSRLMKVIIATNSDLRSKTLSHWRVWFNPVVRTLKPQSDGPLYSSTVIATLAVDGWAVTFGTARRDLGGLRAPHPCTKCN